jgi:hypothetical protein
LFIFEHKACESLIRGISDELDTRAFFMGFQKVFMDCANVRVSVGGDEYEMFL